MLLNGVVKNTKKIVFCMFVFALLCVSFWLGSRTEQSYKEKQESKYEENKNIAIVNLDEGIKVNDHIVNYSAQLMTYPETETELVSLEDARRGILTGRYGAYVIIPASFSRCVESINKTPQNASIEYSINPNLSDEAREIVTNEIVKFQERLNYNTSYLYVSAILDEFHEVQDSSDTIMDNDITDLESIDELDPTKIMSIYEYVELLRLEEDIEPLNFKEVYEANTKTGEKVGDDIFAEIKLSEEEMKQIKEQEVSLAVKTDELKDVISDYNPLLDSEGKTVYEAGLQTMNDYIDERNVLADEKKQSISLKVNAWGADVCQSEIDKIITSLQTGVTNNLVQIQEDNQKQIDDALVKLKLENMQQLDTLRAYYQNQLDSISGNTVVLDDIKDTGFVLNQGSIPLPSVAAISVSNNAVSNNAVSGNQVSIVLPDQIIDKSKIEMEYDKLEPDLDAILVLSKTDIQNTFENEILKSIREENKRQQKLYETDKKNTLKVLGDYTSLLQAYNPYKKIDKEAIKSGVSIINGNSLKVQELQNEHDELYLDHIKEVYKITDENVEALQNSMELSQTTTSTNIDKTVQLLQSNRKEINQENIDLLEDFTTKLASTRIGSVGNESAYKFIANPITANQVVATKSVWVKNMEYDKYLMICIIITLAVVIVLLVINTISVRLLKLEKEVKEI